jgi:protein-disulfide isomerase
LRSDSFHSSGEPQNSSKEEDFVNTSSRLWTLTATAIFTLIGSSMVAPPAIWAQGTQASQSAPSGGASGGAGSATVGGSAAKATPAAPQSPMQKTIEAYVRNLYAFGPDVGVTVSEPKDAGMAGLLETTVSVKVSGNNEDAKFYVSKDGKYLVRGEVSDLLKDPLAANRALMELKDSPSMGDPKSAATLVEFSDFECPVCRSLHDIMRGIMQNYPQVRVVFKDYPIEVLHPWARTAAIAGRCAYQQNPKSFWKMYDLIYDNQDIISAANAWMKMADFAGQVGLNADTFRSCMAGPDAGAAVDASRANGQKLDVNSTPTIFVNGRRMVGADGHLIEQYIQYELAKAKQSGSAK